jgi:hypothetical protein
VEHKGDAHASDAGNGDDERGQAPGPVEWLTVPGRLLLIATVAGAAGVFAWYFLAVVDDLPPGSVPVLFFLAPVAIGAVVFFFVTAFVLRRGGVPIYRQDRDREN